MKCELYSESARQGETNSRGGDGRAAGAQPGSQGPRRGQAGKRKPQGLDRGGRKVGKARGGLRRPPPSSSPALKSPESILSLDHMH